MKPAHFSYIGIGIAAIIFIAFGAFHAVNEYGLQEFTTEAVVLDKHYTPPGSTTRTTVVNNQTIVQSHGTDEIYAVSFEIDGLQHLGLLTEDQFEEVEIGTQVLITARTKRITKDMQITHVAY